MLLRKCIYVNGKANEEVAVRTGKASSVFQKLGNIWKFRKITRKTKLKLYKSKVISVLLYASETWKTNKTTKSRRRGFRGRRLRRIHGVKWQDRVTNREIAERAGIGDINVEIKRRRWKYLRNVLRMEDIALQKDQ
jgi:hypothetical protein